MKNVCRLEGGRKFPEGKTAETLNKKSYKTDSELGTMVTISAVRFARGNFAYNVPPNGLS